MAEFRAENCPVGYTPRVFAPGGKVMFGTWAGPQDKYWEYKGRYGFIGGGTYTGKTDLLRWYPWQQIEEDNARIKAGEITQSFGQALYLLRETPRLREVLNRCTRDFEIAAGGPNELDWKAQEKTYVWPSGYRMTFGHMQHQEDWDKYQGWQITCLLWDELPTFLLPQWDMMDQWVRPAAGSFLTPIHRGGGNPVGVGRPWVKKFFVDAGPKGVEVKKRISVEVEDPDGSKRKETVTRGRIFIFAKVSDNKSVDQAAYLASFDGKPKQLVKAMRDGDFDSAAGDLIGESWDANVHVVKPFRLPAGWQKGRSIHFAFAATTVAWWAIDFDGGFTVYRDLRLENHTADMVTDRVRELEEESDVWRFDRGRDDDEGSSKIIGILGPASAWGTEKSGLNVARTMRRRGLMCRAASEDLKSAADQIRMRLIQRTQAKGSKGEGTPGLRYFATCTASLETVPSMMAAKEDPDLPDAKTESSAYRALCYAAMSRIMTPEKAKPRDDDWDSWAKPKKARVSKSGFPGAF